MCAAFGDVISLNSVGEKFPPFLLSDASGDNLEFCAVYVTVLDRCRVIKSDVELPGSAVIRTDTIQSL